MSFPRRSVILAAVEVHQVARALAEFRPRTVEGVETHRKAAVAAVLRDGAGDVEVLLIRRAEHPRDPWSGHMAFPGGRVDPSDPTPLAAAVRETKEEVGLNLEENALLLGRLSDAVTFRRTADVPAAIVPFVFELRGDPILHPNHEVQEAVWLPWSFLANQRNRSFFLWKRRGVPIPMPCYRYQGRVIWGLTLGMLLELVAVVNQAQR